MTTIREFTEQLLCNYADNYNTHDDARCEQCNAYADYIIVYNSIAICDKCRYTIIEDNE